MGARSAGNPHAACDVEGAGDVARSEGLPARQSSTLPMSGDGKRSVAEWPQATAPILDLYEGLACQDVFREQHFLLFASFKGSSRGRSSALMARRPLCLAALSGQSQSPEGRAGRREGLTAKARAERQWCLAITLRRVLRSC
jgi:hypothetical protein